MAKLKTKTESFECNYAVTLAQPPRLYLVVKTDIDTAKYVFSDPEETERIVMESGNAITAFNGYTTLVFANAEPGGIRISLAKE